MIVIAVVGAVAYSWSASHTGRVVFSTDAPVNGTHSGCTVNDQVTSVTASTAVYATYMFQSAPGSEVISLTIDRDGQAYIPTKPMPTTYTKGYECFSDNSDLSKLPGWGRGTYHFYATAGGSVVAEGDLTVT